VEHDQRTRDASAGIEVDRLTKRFGSFVAVDELSLRIEPGEIFGFLGPNGAGKSTTIRMLCAILRPTTGDARVAGYSIRREPEAVKSRIGYMSQRFSLYEDLTASENIEFYGGVYGLRRADLLERKAAILRMSGLEERANDLTSLLSGGWRQRLALGCAMLHRPPILFLDEPTSGVDPISRRQFWDLIYQTARGGTTVLVTTHYLDEAEYCDRLGLIYGGRMIATGTPDELKDRMADGTLYEIVCDPVMAALDAIGGLPSVRDAALFGANLHVTLKDETVLPNVLETLNERGVRVNSATRVRPSLEDVFVSLVEGEESRRNRP
jgi:ABC-2 type transport system ATP-binding protein